MQHAAHTIDSKIGYLANQSKPEGSYLYSSSCETSCEFERAVPPVPAPDAAAREGPASSQSPDFWSWRASLFQMFRRGHMLSRFGKIHNLFCGPIWWKSYFFEEAGFRYQISLKILWFYSSTKELPGVALVYILNGWIFRGKGNTHFKWNIEWSSSCWRKKYFNETQFSVK